MNEYSYITGHLLDAREALLRGEKSREISLAITKIEEALLWLGYNLNG